jgi:hypothetical protein
MDSRSRTASCFAILLAACGGGAPSVDDGGVLTDAGHVVSVDAATDATAPDVCEGVVCDAPPSDCHEAAGSCVDGDCVYALRPSGAPCDDGVACTTASCAGADCVGVPLVCDEPPAASCADDFTARSYASAGMCSADDCTYPHTDTVCAYGCAMGACRMCESPWTSSILAEMGSVGERSSIVARGDALDVVFYDSTNEDLVYAHRDGEGPWTTSIVDSTNGYYPSLAMDSRGTLHVVYHASTTSIRYARRDASGVWISTLIDADQASGPVLAVDADGGVHVAYIGATRLRYAYRSVAGVWTITNVDPDEYTGYYPSIAVDAAGEVHVSHRELGEEDLRYSHRTAAGEWSTIVVDSDGRTGFNTSLAVDRDGQVHIAYGSYSLGLRHAWRDARGAWETETLDADGAEPSLATDADGLHVSYRGVAGGDLRYAYRGPAGLWTTALVDEPGDVGRDSEIAISNGVHIVYRDFINADLRYAYRPPCEGAP